MNKLKIGYGFQHVSKATAYGLNRLVFVQINVSYAQQRLIAMAKNVRSAQSYTKVLIYSNK